MVDQYRSRVASRVPPPPPPSVERPRLDPPPPSVERPRPAIPPPPTLDYEKIRALQTRLERGWEIIDQAQQEGKNTREMEDFWVDLLTEYVALHHKELPL